MREILCWVEIENDGTPTGASLETLEEAAQIAAAWGGRVVALVLRGAALTDDLEERLAVGLGGRGATQVLVATHPHLATYSTEGWCHTLAWLLRDSSFGLCVGPNSPNGADFMPRLAARLDAPLLTDCLALAPTEGGGLRLTCPAYGNRLHLLYEVEAASMRASRPLLATLRPGVRGLAGQATQGQASVQLLNLDGLDLDFSGTRSLGVLPPDPRTVDIVEAERIVAVGLGLPLETGVRLASDLAGCLGAAVGGTRPVVDKGWLPFSRQIGTTGRSVAPRLYVALGISGAGQHTGGLRGARLIVSINRDRSAPMMALSDLAIVGDAAEIVPLLINKLTARPQVEPTERKLVGNVA